MSLKKVLQDRLKGKVLGLGWVTEVNCVGFGHVTWAGENGIFGARRASVPSPAPVTLLTC